MRDKTTGQALIFVRTKRRADALAKFLSVRGLSVDALHGDMRQTVRQKVLRNFRSGGLRALIATDVAARGIDVAGLSHVVNFDLTDTPEAYVHRIGRTGRAGRPGEAITFFTESDMTMLRSIANVMKLSGCDVPAWMLTMKKMRHSDKKRIKSIPVKRRPISTTAIYDKQKARRLQGAKESSRRAKGEGKEWVNKTERKKRRRMAGSGGGGSGDGGADGDGWTVVK